MTCRNLHLRCLDPCERCFPPEDEMGWDTDYGVDMQHQQLDDATVHALRVYRKAVRGSTDEVWTSVLSTDWSYSGPRLARMYGFPPDLWPPLQRLRNTVGFDLLDQFDQLIGPEDE